MTLTLLVARFFSIALLVVGISHLIQPRLWRDFFILLKRTRVAGIIIAMYTFPQGLLIVLTHNVWVWDVPLILTVCGWGMTFKSILYAFIPQAAERAISEEENAHRKYAAGGAFIIPVSLLLIYHYFFRAA
jgi:hypothetical protein